MALSHHFKSGLSACEKAKFTAVGTKLWQKPSVTQKTYNRFSLSCLVSTYRF